MIDVKIEFIEEDDNVREVDYEIFKVPLNLDIRTFK